MKFSVASRRLCLFSKLEKVKEQEEELRSLREDVARLKQTADTRGAGQWSRSADAASTGTPAAAIPREVGRYGGMLSWRRRDRAQNNDGGRGTKNGKMRGSVTVV